MSATGATRMTELHSAPGAALPSFTGVSPRPQDGMDSTMDGTFNSFIKRPQRMSDKVDPSISTAQKIAVMYAGGDSGISSNTPGSAVATKSYEPRVIPVNPSEPPLQIMIGFSDSKLKGEDRHDVRDIVLHGHSYKLIAIYDGHGGAQAAEYCALHLLQYIEEACTNNSAGGDNPLSDSVAPACMVAFKRCHAEIRQMEGFTAGTTATVLCCDVRRRQVLCANVGDSGVLLIHPADRTQIGFVSTDHRLHNNHKEQTRVLKMGSRLAYAADPLTKMPAGSLRMWPGGLAVGRSLGDSDCGDAISAEPAVNIADIPPHGALFCMCSDGVWDAIGVDDVAKLATASSNVKSAATKVVYGSLRPRGLRDDTTCFVVSICAQKLADASVREESDGEGSIDRSISGAAKRVTSFLRQLVACCGSEAPKPQDMAASIKGGEAFEILYRMDDDEPASGAALDHGGDASNWAGSRIGYGISDAASPAPAPAAMVDDPSEGATALPPSEAPLRTGSPPLRQSIDVAPALASEMDEGVDHVDLAEAAANIDGRRRTDGLWTADMDKVGEMDKRPPALGTHARIQDESSVLPKSKAPPKPIPPGRKLHWNEIGDGGLSDMKYLGSGEFCSVFSTVIDGGHTVALKMLRPTKLASVSAVRDLEFEMHLLSRIHHKHILRCVGTSMPAVPPDRKFLVLQTLRTTLYDALPPPILGDGTVTFGRMNALKRWSMPRSLQLALELAIALRYLHDQCFATYRLLHRDIKPKNLGLMADGRLVVFDFGVSKLVHRHTDAIAPAVKMTGMVGSLRYMAPEVALSRPYNHKSELYSYAIVAWEMVALDRPFSMIVPETFEQRVCHNHERPKLNTKKWHPAICSLLTRCWAPNYNDRPEFKEVVDVMMTVLAAGGEGGNK